MPALRKGTALGGGGTVLNVLVWYENRPLPEHVEAERRVYPNGIHGELSALQRCRTRSRG